MLDWANRGGTPGYWALEIKNDQPISQAGDVYSYGVTLHHLATGIKPKDGQALDVSLPVLKTQPQIAEIIAACCRPISAERPSMQEVLRMLGGTRWAYVQQSRQQRRALALCAVVFLAVVIVTAAR
jgi:serine/threonine protein kinase